MLNRAKRIYPALWFSTLVSVILILVSYKIESIFSFLLYILGQLTFFQFWTPSILRNYGLGNPNGSLGTIFIELQFYIILIFIYYKCNTKKKLLFLFFISIISNIFIGFMNQEMVLTKLLRVFTLPYLYNFLIGSIFYKFDILKKKLLENKFIYWLLLCQVFYILGIIPEYFPRTFLEFVSNFVLSITALSFAFSYTNYLKNFKFDISYGIYLYHMIFLNYFIHNFGVEIIKNSYLWLLNGFLVLFASIFSFYFIEKPMLSYQRK